MAAAAGFLNHQSVAQSLAGRATPMTTPTSGTSESGSTGSSSSTSDDSATISANDFLTLLVTEMQNQDPTADTDPNEYINQLVEVNSLEQLININQTLTTDLGASATSSTDDATADDSASQQARSATADSQANASAAAAKSTAVRTHAATQASQSQAVAQAPGNLGIPATNSAAQRVAHSLHERTRAHPATAPPAIP